jgi:tetratricopeptide (TPR) repeat protein
MKSLHITLCTLLLLMPAVPSMGQALTYQALTDSAMFYTERDSAQKAEYYIRQALKLEPANLRNAMLFSNLGTLQRRAGKMEEALQSYTYALNMAPLSVPVLMNRATLYLDMGRNDAARADCSLALDADPKCKEALLLRAYLYEEERNYAFARSDFQRLLKIDPTHYSARLGLAIVAQKEGQLNKAVAQLDTAIQVNNTLPEAYLMRGQIYLVQQRKTDAQADFIKARSLGISGEEMEELMKASK